MWLTRVVLVLVVSYYCVCSVYGKKYETRCKLVRELLRVSVPNDLFLGQWVCLIEKVSNRNTSAYTVSPSGKKFYGLYQIPSKWCKLQKPGGDCNIKCEDLLDDDIRDDTACAVKIYHQEGFKYWTVWTTRCKNDNFITNEIYKCPDLRFSLDRSSPVNTQPQNRHGIHKRSENSSLHSILKRSILQALQSHRVEEQSRHIN
ncbi:unnamed protein product [Arctia plantaginis]|uniref:Lysozyme n=1 Tax=Arctia plantaginis TaxID=874455 RepID=A0A8S0YZL8_ARCPL|nr:unnamed protein product [Arctia plantaginis]